MPCLQLKSVPEFLLYVFTLQSSISNATSSKEPSLILPGEFELSSSVVSPLMELSTLVVFVHLSNPDLCPPLPSMQWVGSSFKGNAGPLLFSSLLIFLKN